MFRNYFHVSFAYSINFDNCFHIDLSGYNEYNEMFPILFHQHNVNSEVMVNFT